MHRLLFVIVICVILTCHGVDLRLLDKSVKAQSKHKSSAKKNSAQSLMTDPNAKINEVKVHKPILKSGSIKVNDKPNHASERKISTSRKYTICAVVCNEELYIKDWIDYHLLLGFDTIYLFDNSRNGSAMVAYLPQFYDGTVKVTRAAGSGVQIKIYNLFVQHIGLASSVPMWTAFIDVDEYIVLRKHPNIQTFLSEVAPAGGAVALNRIQFGSNGQLKYQNAPVLSRFTARKATAERTVKSIVYLPDVVSVQLYNSVLRNTSYTVRPNGKKVNAKREAPYNSMEVASIHHYYTKSMEEFRTKKLRGHALNAHLNVQYNSSVHSDNLILTEFIEADAGANAVQDTFAWDFYKKKLSEKTQ